MQKIKVIIFDLDNTLIDFMLMKEEACKAAVRAMIDIGLDMTENEAYDLLMKTYFRLGLESDKAFTEFLKEAGKFDHKILAAAVNSYLERKNSFLVSYPDVKSVLKKLRSNGIVLSIVTDAPKTKAYQRLLKMGLESYFRVVLGFEDTGKTKETGLPLKLALERLQREVPGLANSEILMVGDSIERDMEPAKKLGLKTALAKYGQTDKGTSESIDHELHVISDLLAIV
jgi:putative hydrolase of the HAD superfamily